MTSSQRTGIILLVLSAAGYAFMPILTKWAFERGIEPLELLTWRFIFAAPAVLGVVVFARANAHVAVR
jgi:EamA domain-containing membrane protein RarD